MSVISGHVDEFHPPNVLTGWALNKENPEHNKPLVCVFFNGEEVGRAIANRFRGDLQQFGSGNYAYSINVSLSLDLQSFTDGRLKVIAELGPGTRLELPISDNLKLFSRLMEAGRLLAGLETYNRKVIRSGIQMLQRFASSNVLHRLAPVLTNTLNDVSTKRDVVGLKVSPIMFPVGMTSSDGAAKLGLEGHLFLIGGTNNTIAQFAAARDSEPIRSTATGWTSLIDSRIEVLAGTTYIQIIVPEKISIYPTLFGSDISVPTPLLSEIEHEMEMTLGRRQVYMSALELLSRKADAPVFLKTDTHLSPFGSYCLSKAVTEKLTYDICDLPVWSGMDVISGDLTSRFFGANSYEVMRVAQESPLGHTRTLVVDVRAKSGHIGKRRVWRNEHAPIKEKVVAFGNSFMDGSTFQGSLSYWFSMWFAEYHFVFSPEMDIDYIRSTKPSVVICQTIERFLYSIPAR